MRPMKLESFLYVLQAEGTNYKGSLGSATLKASSFEEVLQKLEIAHAIMILEKGILAPIPTLEEYFRNFSGLDEDDEEWEECSLKWGMEDFIEKVHRWQFEAATNRWKNKSFSVNNWGQAGWTETIWREAEFYAERDFIRNSKNSAPYREALQANLVKRKYELLAEDAVYEDFPGLKQSISLPLSISIREVKWFHSFEIEDILRLSKEAADNKMQSIVDSAPESDTLLWNCLHLDEAAIQQFITERSYQNEEL